MSAVNQDARPRPAASPALSHHGCVLEIPDYELMRRIGRGSYGEVWLARNVLGGFRAAKFIERAAFADPRPFEREFAGIQKFEPISRTHPGFVHILHAGRNEGRGYFYYVMEMADDVEREQACDPAHYAPRTLASDLARRARLSLDECGRLGISLASALDRLHRHGLIHRDIKPANIVFVGGAPKLADIGLVVAIGDADGSLGTAGYFPPDEPASPATDLFGLGMVLYEAVSGKSPAQFAELPTALESASQFASFNEALLRACDADPRRRFHSAEGMRAALARCLGHEEARGKSREAPRAERKLLTVLAINLAATRRADPEAWQAFMCACLEHIRPSILRYEGSLIQTLSDGVLCGFGGAIAMEDHARRAVLAALEIKQALTANKASLMACLGFDFIARLGLSSGLAIAERGKDGTVPAGDAVNLASRILAQGGADEIILTHETWKLVKDYCETRPIRGAADALASQPLVYSLLGAGEWRRRIDVETERGLTPFVGRQRDLDFLHDKLRQAQAGRGQIVLLAGEPGMGKSRLLLEFQRSLERERIHWASGRSISFGGQMAWLPIIDLVKHLLGVKEGDPPTAVSGRVEAAAAALGSRVEAAWPFVRYLLSLDTEDAPVAGMEARERRTKTFESLRNIVLTKARQKPLVVSLEDLHWADKTSIEFLVSLSDFLGLAPLLVLLTYRPDYRNPFPERSFIGRLMLQPLSDDETRSLAGRVLKEKSLPEGIQRVVIEKAEGNPFFVEEMVRCLNEAGALDAPGDRPEIIDASASALPVPDTIHDVIMSRIDRLEESPRTILQLASVIGREFSVALLGAIADLDEPLADSLQKLKGLELIYERGSSLEQTCYFKHALTQEVAYNSLLRQRRKELHCLVAAAVEETGAARLPEFYGLLAYHYERGEEWEQALDYLRRAAEQCRRVGAYREEILQLTQAMAVAKRLGQTDLLAELQGLRGTARVKVGLCAEAKPDLEAALAALPYENRARRAELVLSLAGACFWNLDTIGAQRFGAEGLALAEEAGREDLAAEALTFLGASQQSLGNLASARGLFEQARAKGGASSPAALANYPLTLYLNGRLADAVERAREAAEAFRGSSDAFASAFGHPHLGMALAGQGRYAEAAAVFEEARQLGSKHEIWHFHARAVGMSAGFHLDVFDLAGHENVANEARECARSAPFRPTEVSATIDLIFNAIRRGRAGQAEKFLKEGETLVARVAGWHEWLWKLRLKQACAEVACLSGKHREALELASEAIRDSRAHGRPKYVAAGLETRAKSLAALGRAPDAVADLRHACELARTMGDPALFVRAASGLLLLEGDDVLLTETRLSARRIFDALPGRAMRETFQSAEPVAALGPFLSC